MPPKKIVKKTADTEIVWPYRKAVIDGFGGGALSVELNRTKKHFDADAITITILRDDKSMEIDVSRDELAQIILVAYDVRKEYQDALKLEEKNLRYEGII